MANYCWNWVHFTGKKENLQRLVDGLEKAKSLNEDNQGLIWYKTFFTALGSEPPEEPTDVYDDFGSKWYEIQEIEFDGEGITITGTSAWSPVSQFFLKLSEVYELHFDSEFEESGCDFGGFFAGNNGKVTDDRTYTYAQYEWLQRDFESIDLDWHEFEDEEDAIEHYSQIREFCNEKEWKGVLDIISYHFKDKEK